MTRWLPGIAKQVVMVAVPELFRVPVPKVASPSVKVTVPVGTPSPGATALTVAVYVTDWAVVKDCPELVTAVVVCACATGTSSVMLLWLKFWSPL